MSNAAFTVIHLEAVNKDASDSLFFLWLCVAGNLMLFMGNLMLIMGNLMLFMGNLMLYMCNLMLFMCNLMLFMGNLMLYMCNFQPDMMLTDDSISQMTSF